MFRTSKRNSFWLFLLIVISSLIILVYWTVTSKFNNHLVQELSPLEIKDQDSFFFQKGTDFKKRGNYDSSFYYFYKGLEFAEASGQPANQAKHTNNIGLIHSRLRQFTKAEDYLLSALKIYEALSDTLRIAYLYNNMGLMEEERDNFKEASNYYNQSIRLKKGLNISGLRLNYNNPGTINRKLKKYAQSLKYHGLALHYIKEANKPHSLCETYMNFGDVYFDQKKYETALLYYDSSYQIGITIKATHTLEKVLGKQAGSYAGLGIFDKAYQYRALQNSFLDSLINNRNQSVEIEFKHLLSDQESESQKGLSLVISEKNFIIILLCTVFFLVIVIVIYIYIAKKKSLQSTILLQNKSEQLKERHIEKLLQEQEMKSMKSFLEGKEDERARTSRDLHDSLGGTLASLKLKLEYYFENQNDSLGEKIMTEFNEAYQEVRSISHNLLPPKFNSTSFTDLLKTYISQISANSTLSIQLELQVEESLNGLDEKVKVELYRIVQECFSNILTHSEADKVEVQLLMHDAFVNLIVEDNGKGFAKSGLKQGIGLSNIASRVKLLNGSIDMDSVIRRGTFINIDIPI